MFSYLYMLSPYMPGTVLPCSILPAIIKEYHYIDIFRFTVVLQCNVHLTLHRMDSTCNGDFC
jgi:hypothetical protein